MNNKLVTIITPTKNAEKTILRTLDSIQAQTYKHIESIIIDCCSTDQTLQIVRNHPIVTKIISEQDNGIAHAFNKGLDLSSGEVIGILNADDWYEPNAVSTAVSALFDKMGLEQFDIAHGSMAVWKNTNQLYRIHPDEDKLFLEMTINHPTVFIRKECYNRWGNFDQNYKYAMDYELLLRFKIRGAKFITIPALLTNMQTEGFSDRFWLQTYTEAFRARQSNIGNNLPSTASYIWCTCRTATRRTIEKFGCSKIIAMWRRHFSSIQKTI